MFGRVFLLFVIPGRPAASSQVEPGIQPSSTAKLD
jgi:hypothetical protein